MFSRSGVIVANGMFELNERVKRSKRRSTEVIMIYRQRRWLRR